MNTNWTEKQVSELFDAYDDWVENDFGYRPLIKKIITRYGKRISLLDYGCGSGKVARRLHSAGIAHVTGVDIAPTMIAKATATGEDNLNFHLLDQPQLPFYDNQFEVAISCFLFINVPERAELLRISREVARVLKPGGAYYILDTHPGCINIDYPTYRNGVTGVVYNDGDDRPVTLTTPGGEKLEIIDKHWEEETYHQCFVEAGLTLEEQWDLPFDNACSSTQPVLFKELQGSFPFILFRAVKQ